MRLGLYGGTFDPPHIGHLIVAHDAFIALGLDRIILIPAGAPPHKQGRVVTPAELRLGMLAAAVDGDPRFDVDSVELDRDGPSYTVDTVVAMQEKYPGAELYLLMGADQFAEFRTWRDPHRIADLARVAVLSRPGVLRAADAELEAFGAQWVTVTALDISSSDIRQRRGRGESVRYLVPPGVEAFLDNHDIYVH